jgi:hypothetical protein
MIALALNIVAFCVILIASIFAVCLLVSPFAFFVGWLAARNDPKCGPLLRRGRNER